MRACAILILAAGCVAPSDGSTPTPPAELMRWLTGSSIDVAPATSNQGGLLLMGGGTDVDQAFAWQRDRIGGGNVVVLRASGSDGYNDYLFSEIGGVGSVETLLVDRRALADDAYVAWQLDHAEAIFLAGGDQAVYLATWKGTELAAALQRAAARRVVLGGTSAGCMVLGRILFSAEKGSITSSEALADPYDAYATLDRDFVKLPSLDGVITDTHFAERDRMGRLVGFLARIIQDGWRERPVGIGIDEATALVVDEAGQGSVLGQGAVHVLSPTNAPTRCAPGEALSWASIALHTLRAGDTVSLPMGSTTAPAQQLSVDAGVLDPPAPY